MDDWIGATWGTVAAVALSTVLIYVSAIVVVRVGGRRTITQLSAFDAVVTIALGSLLATTAVTRSTSYAEGLTAIVTLLVLQTGLAAVRQKVPRLRRLVDFSPELVVDGGEPVLSDRPWSSQLTDQELASQLRQKGLREVTGTTFVILEPNGSMTVLDDLSGLPDMLAPESVDSDGTRPSEQESEHR